MWGVYSLLWDIVGITYLLQFFKKRQNCEMKSRNLFKTKLCGKKKELNSEFQEKNELWDITSEKSELGN